MRRVVLAIVALLVVGTVATRALVARAESEHPRLGRVVDVDGLAQHVIERGAGDAIVLVHGAFGSSHDFVATVLDSLAARHRCVVWDRPGHGYSERPEGEAGPGVQADVLLALLDELDVERPLLVGFSYGGAVVLAAALRAPERVRGVVLLNGPSHPWPDPIELHYRLPTVPLLGPLVVETLLMPFGAALSDSSVERAFAPRPVADAFESSPVLLALRPPSYRANAEDIRTLKPFLRAQSEHYDELAVPLTIVVSEGDLVVHPTIHSLPLHRDTPDSTMIRLPDAGHQILYTHTDFVIDTIETALRVP